MVCLFLFDNYFQDYIFDNKIAEAMSVAHASMVSYVRSSSTVACSSACKLYVLTVLFARCEGRGWGYIQGS